MTSPLARLLLSACAAALVFGAAPALAQVGTDITDLAQGTTRQACNA